MGNEARAERRRAMAADRDKKRRVSWRKALLNGRVKHRDLLSMGFSWRYQKAS